MRFPALLVLAVAGPAAAADPLPPGVARRVGDARFLHTEDIRAAAPSADGRLVASVDRRTIYLWDTATGETVFRTTCEVKHERDWVWVGWVGGRVRAVAWAGGSVDGLRTVDLDPRTGKVLRRGPVAEAGRVRASVVAPGGDRVALVTRAGPGDAFAVALQDLSTDRTPFVLGVVATRNPFIEFAPDGKTVAVGDRGPTVRLYDAATGAPARELETGADSAAVGPFTPDGRGLVVFAERGGKWSAQIRDATTGAVRAALPTDADGRFVRVRFAPDGKRAALQEHRAAWEMIDLATRAVAYKFPDDTEQVEFAADGRTAFAVAASRQLLTPHDAATGKPTLRPAGPVYRVRFRNDGKLLGLAGGRIVTWDPLTGAEVGRSPVLPELSADDPAFGSISPDGTRYAGLADGDPRRVHLYDLATGRIVAGFDTGVPRPAPVFTRAGHLVLTHTDRTGVYDAATGAEVASLRVRLAGFRGKDASADGRRVSVGTPAGVAVFAVPSADPVARFDWPGEGGVGSALSPDGRTVIGIGGGVLAAWDVGTGRRRWAVPLPGGEGRWANVLPDGRTATVIGRNESILLVELATGGVRHTFAGAGDKLSFGVSPDGRWLASAVPHAPVFVWDVRGSVSPAGPEPDAAGLAKLWADLGSADAAVGFRAVRALARHPSAAVPFLRERVKPVSAADPVAVAKWVSDLDSPAFAVREAAARELKKLGELAEPAVSAAEAKTASTEVRERASAILSAAGKPSSEAVRALRAAEALEWMGTPAARDVLAALAGGADGSRLTRDATAAVARLK